MKTQVRKIGNSLGNIIPSAIIRQLKLQEGAELDVQLDGSRIVIKPTSRKKVNFLTEEELLSGSLYTAENSDLLAQPLQNEWVD